MPIVAVRQSMIALSSADFGRHSHSAGSCCPATYLFSFIQSADLTLLPKMSHFVRVNSHAEV